MGELIKVLPEIIYYLVIGFIFLQSFRLTYRHKPSTDIFTTSLVIGFGIVKLFNQIPKSINVVADRVLIALATLLIGYFVGRLLDSRTINWLFDKLKISKTTHSNLWDDLKDDTYISRIEASINGNVYRGLFYLEEEAETPKIALSQYSINDGPINHDKVIILDTAKADYVTIEYSQNSPMSKDIKFGETHFASDIQK